MTYAARCVPISVLNPNSPNAALFDIDFFAINFERSIDVEVKLVGALYRAKKPSMSGVSGLSTCSCTRRNRSRRWSCCRVQRKFRGVALESGGCPVPKFYLLTPIKPLYIVDLSILDVPEHSGLLPIAVGVKDVTDSCEKTSQVVRRWRLQCHREPRVIPAPWSACGTCFQEPLRHPVIQSSEQVVLKIPWPLIGKMDIPWVSTLIIARELGQYLYSDCVWCSHPEAQSIGRYISCLTTRLANKSRDRGSK